MAGFALYAVLGLLLLVPLEMLFLIMVAALTRKRELVPKLAAPSLKKQGRYGWEDMLKLSPKSKPSGRSRAVLAVIIILLLVVVVAAPGLFLVAPSLQLNLSKQSANDTSILPPSALNETAGRDVSFSNLTPLRFNISVPDVNLSKVFAPLKASLRAVAFGLLVVLAVFVAVFLIVRRRKLAVVKKAGETAEKLIRKASAEKKGKEPPKVGGSMFLMFGKAKNYLVPAIIIFLLVVIALLVYILRDRIRNEFSGKLVSFAVSAKEFALNYRLYIIAGIVVLVICVFLLRLIAKSQQKPA